MTEDLIARGRELAKAFGPGTSSSVLVEDVPGRRLIVTRGSQVKLLPLVWWEPDLVLRAAINLLAGREANGKSTIAASWAARETRAGGTVMWIGSEEPREQAQAPRLVAAGADMDRVVFIDVEVDDATRALVFPLDLGGIEQVIRQHGVTMLVLDPCKGVMPAGISGNDDIAIRQYLEPIATMAARCDVVVLGLVHFGKRDSADSGKLILGSIAWSQVARSVLSVAEDPETGNRVLTNTKCNFSEQARSVECRIVGKTITTTNGPSEMGTVEWIGDTHKDARHFLGERNHDDDHDIDTWLTDFLVTGSRKANDVYTAADAQGFSRDQAKRAKKRLGVKAERPSGDGPWFWSMPADQEVVCRPLDHGAQDQGSTDQGSTPLSRESAPLLPCTSEGVRSPENGPREQGAHERSLGPPGGLSPDTPGQTDRVLAAVAKAGQKYSSTRSGTFEVVDLLDQGGDLTSNATSFCQCGEALLSDNDSGLCAECRLIARKEAVAQQIGALDGEAS